MALIKRGGIWWFDFRFEGIRYQRSTKERNKNKAQGITAAFRTALANRCVGIIERKPAPTFGAALKSFLLWSEEEHREHPATYRRYKASSKPLLAFHRFKGKSIDEITPAMIEEYKARRARQSGKQTKRPLRPATINRELACLKAIFNHALKDRHDFANPVSDVEFLPERNEQTRVLSFEEQRKYLAAATPNVKDVSTLILETAMRPEEVYRMRVENVELIQGYVFVPFGKTRAARRRIPLTATALAVLKRRIEAQTVGYLFPHRNDPQRHITTVAKGHKTALRDSKVRPFRLYDCRHTWATRAAEAGVDLTTLAALLGHGKLNMVMRYAHPQEQHQVDTVKRLEAFNAAKEIAEVEKAKQAEKLTGKKTVPTVLTTVPNPATKTTDENPPVN